MEWLRKKPIGVESFHCIRKISCCGKGLRGIHVVWVKMKFHVRYLATPSSSTCNYILHPSTSVLLVDFKCSLQLRQHSLPVPIRSCGTKNAALRVPNARVSAVPRYLGYVISTRCYFKPHRLRHVNSGGEQNNRGIHIVDGCPGKPCCHAVEEASTQFWWLCLRASRYGRYLGRSVPDFHIQLPKTSTVNLLKLSATSLLSPDPALGGLLEQPVTHNQPFLRLYPHGEMKANDALALIILAYAALGILVCVCIVRFAVMIRRRIHGTLTTNSVSKSTSSTGSATNYGDNETSESSASTADMGPGSGPLPPAPPPVGGAYPYAPPPPVPPLVGLGGMGYVPGMVPPPPPPVN